MTPDFKPGPQEEMEARVTALLLGELPEAEAAEMRAAIKRDPELARLCQRLKGTIELVRQASAPAEPATAPAAPMRLSESRRQQLFQRFKTVAPRQFASSRRERTWSVLIPLAALVMFLFAAALFMPALSRSKSRAQYAASSSLETLGLPSGGVPAIKETARSPIRAGEQPTDGTSALSLKNESSTPLSETRKLYSVNAVGYSGVDASKSKPATAAPASPPAIATPSAERVAGAALYMRKLDEVAQGVQNLAGEESLRRGVAAKSATTSGNAKLGLLPTREPAVSATPPAAGQPVATPQTPAFKFQAGDGLADANIPVTALPHVATAGGGFGGGGGGGGFQAGTWFETAKQSESTEKLAELAQNANRGDAAWTERFSRRYGLARQPQTAPAATPAPVPDTSAGIAAKPQDQPHLGFRLMGPKTETEWAVKPASPEGKKTPEGSVRGFYDDSGIAPKDTTAAETVNGVISLNGMTTIFANRSRVAADKAPVLGDLPAAGRLFRSAGKETEALGHRGDQTVQLQDHFYGDFATLQGGAVPATTNAVTEDQNAFVTRYAFSGANTWGKTKGTEVLGKEVAGRQSVTVPDPQPVDPSTGLPVAISESRFKIEPTTGLAQVQADADVKLVVKAPPPVPQPEVTTADNPFSTFSLNVADVSFRLAEASLTQGQMPDPASIRSEEFINAFDYRDPEPPPGTPVAFAYDRSRNPFAHNRDLLRFSIETAAAGRQQGSPLNLVLLLDSSGSMERADRVNIVREALRVLGDQLRPEDKISLVTFSRTARLWAAGVPGNQVTTIRERVAQLTPEGGTNLEEAMNLAYQTALQQYLAGGINRVVLLTDGAANLGNVDPDQLKAKVEAHRKQGIALDCFGIGWEDYNDNLLEVLARNGDGRYGFLNSPEETASEFAAKLAGALRVAASDVKVQVEFNPARVASYRQVGYAKHQLTKEQFRDNTVDAAEIGAAEAGNALYVVETNPQGSGPVATVRVRFKVPGTSDYREHEWMVPYTGNAISLDQANPAMRLCATTAAFSEWLAGNPYAGEVSPDQLLSLLRGVKEVYGPDARPQKLEWMIRQAKSISGK